MQLAATLNRFSAHIAALTPTWLIGLVMRIALFQVFWTAAQTKISGSKIFGQKWQFWNVTDSAILLFEYEYNLPLIPPTIAAYAGTLAEFFLALGILFGVMTRFSALGLLIVTLVIQFLVNFNDWPVHILWAGPLLYLLKHGPGTLSVDAALGRRG